MAALTIVYWRDIPAQVIAKAGRRNAKAELPGRFMEAIDAAAMRAGATGTDAYLADWRRGDPTECSDDLEQAVAETVASLEKAYDNGRLKSLIESGGRNGPGS
jgi:diketogulonate reductase-like aldo/keto reductase